MAPLKRFAPKKTPLQSLTGGRIGGGSNQVLSPPLLPNTHQVQNLSLALKIHSLLPQPGVPGKPGVQYAPGRSWM